MTLARTCASVRFVLTETTNPASSAPVAPFEIGCLYTLHPWRAEWLNEKLGAIAKRATRSGVHCSPRLEPTSEPYPVWVKETGAAWASHRCPDGLCMAVDSPQQKCEGGVCLVHWHQEIFQDFRAMGVMPVLPGGWRLLAAVDRVRLSPDTPMVTIVREAPGRVCPPEFCGDNAANRCDHCDTHRVRKVVYVLQNLDARTIQVGSTCVAEFIRDVNVEAAIDAILAAAAAWAGVPTEDEDGNPFCGREHNGPKPLHTYLSHVAAYTRGNHNVYVTRAAAGEGRTATGDAGYEAMTARTPKERAEWPDLRKPVDSMLATAAIEWAKQLPANGSAFEQNMRTFATAGFFTPQHKGTAAYIVPAYQRATQQAGSYPVRAVAGRLKADVGDKVRREVEVVKVTPYESQFGRGYVSVMRVVSGEDAGAIVKWMSGNTPMIRSKHNMAQVQCAIDELAGLRPPHPHNPATQAWIDAELARPQEVGAQPGDRVTIEFKVKAHGEYRGALETTVSHVKRVCQGWGYAADAGTDEARIRDAQVAAGHNAPPVVKVKKPRKPTVKQVLAEMVKIQLDSARAT